MALKLSLKANEKLIIGHAVVRNGAHHAELYVENNTPILRQKDILTEAEADTPSRRLYFTLQLMYIDPGHATDYLPVFREMATDIAAAAPSFRQLLEEITGFAEANNLYRALKSARQLINREAKLLSGARPK